MAEELARSVPEEGRDLSLANGAAGHAVLFAALEGARPGRGHRDRAVRCVARALDGIRELGRVSLYLGVTGVGWAAEQLRRLGAVRAHSLLDELDASLEVVLRRGWPGTVDLVEGLAGLGVYALARLPRPAARRSLELVVQQLAARAVVEPRGTTWPARDAAYRDIGLAHGVAGVVAFLAAAADAGVERVRIEPLLRGAARWLLAAEREDDPESLFPAFEVLSGEPATSRTAWCYGDPGVALALFHASRALSDERLRGAAIRVARAALGRPPERTHVADEGLCHGSAGLAHIATRFHRATGEAAFAHAARAWLARAVAAVEEHGAGRALVRQEDGSLRSVRESGLLTGAAGVALALLDAARPLTLEWEGFLLTMIGR